MAGVLVLGVIAGCLWFAVSPRTLGFWISETQVSYEGSDDPTATVAALYLLIAVVAGLVCGLPAIGIGDRHVLLRAVTAIGSGLPAGLVAYAVGFVLGPPSVAAQQAAHAGSSAVTVQVPLVLPSPLFALAWPAATASMITVGLLLMAFVAPTRYDDATSAPPATADDPVAKNSP